MIRISSLYAVAAKKLSKILHEKAKQNLDKRALELRWLIMPINLPQTAKESVFPEPKITATITEEDLLAEPEITMINAFGAVEVRLFHDESGSSLGINAENIEIFDKFCASVAKNFKELVSIETVADLSFKFLKNLHADPEKFPSFCQYFISEAEPLVQIFTVFLPINGLRLQSEVVLGEVCLIPITSKVIEDWFQQSENPNAKITEYEAKLKEKYQGAAGALVKIEAEQKQAERLAEKKAQKMLSILRYFSPVNIEPKYVCYVDLMGQSHVNSRITITRGTEENLSITEKNDTDHPRDWPVDDKEVERMKAAQLEKIVTMVRDPNSDFEKLLADCILIYCQNNLKKSLYERFLYIFAALEKMLLRNSSEPLMQNISERMAFLIAQNPKDRQRVITVFKIAYGVRSSFFHHGTTLLSDEDDDIKEFLRNTWQLFSNLVTNKDGFSTKEDLIAFLEVKKLS